MQANKLTSGDWVQTESGKIPFRVTFSYLSDLENYPDNDIVGIPLTPEILEKAGFEEIYKSPMHTVFEINDKGMYYYFWHSQERNEQYLSFSGKDIPTILHVHQLQKLYFALTETELEITL